MEWIVSNKNNKIKLAVIVALVAFSTVFLVTGLWYRWTNRIRKNTTAIYFQSHNYNGSM
jgi:hypothetical protein